MKKRLYVGVAAALLIVMTLTACGCKHEYSLPTCVMPSTCRLCGETVGVPTEHQLSAATCEEPSQCKTCGKVVGEPVDHLYSDGVCVHCGKEDISNPLHKKDPAEGRPFFNSDIKPELSAEGVKGRLKEAYYTKDGGLGVTLSLSNGTASRHELVRVRIRIFNDADETVAEDTVSTFRGSCEIDAGGYSDVYFVIDKDHVYKQDDSLSALGTTLEIGSKAVGASEEPDGTGPKDIAPNRTYYENVGNVPPLSEDGVKATLVRAAYTNDGSLAVTLMVSNGTGEEHIVESVHLKIENGNNELIADAICDAPQGSRVLPDAYAQVDVIVDTSDVQIKEDSLATLTVNADVKSDAV